MNTPMRGIDRRPCLLLKSEILRVTIFFLILFPLAGITGQEYLWATPEEAKVNIQLLEEQLDRLAGDARDTAARLGRAALPVLLKRSRAESPRERVLVLECLAKVQGDEAVLALVKALQDSEQDVWNTALDLLHTTYSPVAVGPLKKLLMKSPQARVRGEVARVLGRMGAAAALPAIKAQAEKESDKEAAHKMNLSAARLEDGPARKKIVERLSNPDPKIRYQAVGEIEYVNDPGLVKNLIPLFFDEARVVNVGQERWPVWHRVCDRALEAAAALTGKQLPFPVGRRSYTAEQIQQARELFATTGK